MELIDEILSRENLTEALRKVESNGGSPGVDKVTVGELREHLKSRWPKIRKKILKGTYKPKMVKRVEIPKAGGGARLLGIPTTTDRVIQQAILQKLTPIFDPGFSENSFGFRKGRSQHDAIRQAKLHIQSGLEYVVDLDLEKFFDRINHDVLMSRIERKVDDKRVLRLIRGFLTAGILAEGIRVRTDEGTPQGGPLSPLLANILLDDLDKELEKRGHAFCRYADDCNIYVRTRKSGNRVKESVTRFLEKKLKLKVNEEKSGVARANERTFLGFAFVFGKELMVSLSKNACRRFKDRIRQITDSSRSRSMESRIRKLNGYVTGWLAYYALVDTRNDLENLEKWVRRRLRLCMWSAWRLGRTRLRKLMGLGLSREYAARIAYSSRGGWRISLTPQLHKAMGTRFWEAQGLMSMMKRYGRIREGWRTAVYGTVRTVV